MTDDDAGSDQSAEPKRSPQARIIAFVRRRPWFTLGLVFFSAVIVQLVTLPFAAVVRLKTVNPPETAFMVYQAEQAKDLRKPFRKRQTWIGLSQVRKPLIDAVIVSEDGSFWDHSGFDWFELRESFVRNVREGKVARGASTISQQLIKNLFLSPSKNPVRKLKEWILTWWLEQNVSKSRILELYLNLIEWGDGIYGIEAASRAYFGKSASELSVKESTRLAAVIPNPKRWNPVSSSPLIDRRAGLILQRMLLRGWIVAPTPDTVIDSSAANEPLPEEPEPPDVTSPAQPPQRSGHADTLMRQETLLPQDTLVRQDTVNHREL